MCNFKLQQTEKLKIIILDTGLFHMGTRNVKKVVQSNFVLFFVTAMQQFLAEVVCVANM